MIKNSKVPVRVLLLATLLFLAQCGKDEADASNPSTPGHQEKERRSLIEAIVESPAIQIVKNGEMRAFQGQTVGSALDGYEGFENKKWDVKGDEVVFLADIPVRPGSEVGRMGFSFQYQAVFGVSGASFRVKHSGFLVSSARLKEPADIEDSQLGVLKMIYEKQSLDIELMKAAASAGLLAAITGAIQKVEPKTHDQTVVPITEDFEKGSPGTIQTLKMNEQSSIRVAYVPGGGFTIGSGADDPADPNEPAQQVQVNLSSHFWMGVTEITQSQWLLFNDANPSLNQKYRESEDKQDTANHPVENISYEEARSFVSYLQALRPLPEGWEWSLPTEAQWERACREGLGGREWRGVTEEQAWQKTNSGGEDNDYTQAVGSKKPNDLGIYDMMGNVAEFTRNIIGNQGADELIGGTDPVGYAPAADLEEHWDGSVYSESLRKQLQELKAKHFPEGNDLPIHLYPEHDVLRERFGIHIYKHLLGWQRVVIRGGAYTSPQEELHPARRLKERTNWRDGRVGFRVAIVRKADRFNPPLGGQSPDTTLDGGQLGAGVQYTLDGVTPSIVLRCVPSGDHPLGTYNGDEGEFAGIRHPKRIVRLSHPFWVAESEMTESQLQALFPADERGRSPLLPATKISAQMAASIVAKLNTKKLLPSGWIWAIPTTEQWEIACRGEVADEFSGNLNEMAWHALEETRPVRTTRPNAFGLYDMHGNVAEWCLPLPFDFDSGAKPAGRLKGGSISSDYLQELRAYHSIKQESSSDVGLHTGLRLFVIPEDKAKAAIELVSLDPLSHPDAIKNFQMDMSKAAEMGMIYTTKPSTLTISDPDTTKPAVATSSGPASTTPVPMSAASTQAMPSNPGKQENESIVQLKIAELEGELASLNAKIEAERKRWQDAHAIINALTRNGTVPVRRNSPEHVKMYENQLVIKEVEAGAGTLKEEKARVEAMLKSLKVK